MSEANVEITHQHAEEAAVIWSVREMGIHRRRWSFRGITKTDERIEAHIDGLRSAGDGAWDICCEALDQGGAGEIFAAAVLAFESGDEGRIREVLEVGTKSPELLRGLVSALGWISWAQAEGQVKKLLASKSAVLRRVGIAASAINRQDPGRALEYAVSDADLPLRARALRAVGELGRTDLRPYFERNWKAEDEECRFWAAWSSVLFRDRYAIPVLRSFVSPKSRRKEQALTLALRLMELESAHAWQRELAQKPESKRLAVIGAGAIGDPALVPWLIEQMAVPDLARVAGESFSMITGVDLAFQDLEGKKPEGFESGPNDDPNDDNVEMDPDDNLPWPAPELITKWWAQHHADFAAGARHLLGKPMTDEWLRQVLRTGRQCQRAAAALELAMLNPGQPLFEVRAPGFRQNGLLK
jgi:uncharacterized protein (TIGR02270 family)